MHERRITIVPSIARLTVVWWFFFLTSFASAQTEPPAPRTGPSDLQELEAFIDGMMAADLKAAHIPGAVVSIVRDGRLLFTKGYGWANVEQRTPVVPDRTLFRLASVSKLFTWTAVMQLVETGRLDIDADVNRYLTDLAIPATFEQPVTLAHLMTHTPGFEDRVVGLFARSPDVMVPLGRVLGTGFPARVRPPGELAAYSNHGTALAGYIVQAVSGIPWERYIETRILVPLAMRRTAVTQPLPADLAGDLASGYSWDRGDFSPGEFEYIAAAPAGGMSASAVDMANFMIAHLQEGRFEDKRILEEQTARLMQRQRYSPHPLLNGMTLGFMEFNRSGHRIIGHGGDTQYFHTLLAIFPDHRLGLFVAYNGTEASRPRDRFFKAFVDRYFPPEHPVLPVSAPAFDAARFEGFYGPSRRAYTTLDKIAGLMGVQVEAGEGVLITRSPLTDEERWVPIEPLVFRKTDEDEHLVFREDGAGRITHLFSELPVIAYLKLPWYEGPGFHAFLLVLAALASVSVLLFWPVARWVAGRRRADRARSSPVSRLAVLLAWGLALLNLLFLLLFAVSLANPFEIVFGLPRLLRTALYLTPAIAALSLIVAILAAAAWWKGFWRRGARIVYTLFALVALAFVWQLNYWNLV